MKRDRIQEAMESGEKNLRTMKLIQNWCAHAKIVKHGGVGLVEQQTGLPIGHHFIECPHAPAGGMAAFDLADTAIDFYDRNCHDCTFRKPVGMPNITILIAERDKHKLARDQEQEKAAQQVADKLTAREAIRAAIRPNLSSLSAATLDQISELDRTRSEAAAVALVGLAELAPETFSPEIVEHLFSLASEGEHWLLKPSLQALDKLSVDDKRLCNVAMQSLRSYGAREVAARIVEKRVENVDPALIEIALPALVDLANPRPIRFSIPGGRSRSPVKGPLLALYGAHTTGVKSAIKSILEKTKAYEVRTAVRALETLADSNPELLDFLPLPLVSKLVRAEHLVQGDEEDVDDALGDIRIVLTRSFLRKPVEINAIIDQYLAGARDANAAELYKVFDDVLRGIRFDRDEKPVEFTDAHRLAFQRMVGAATRAKGNELEEAATSLFHGDPYDLTPLVAENLALLLGSAAVLHTALEAHEAEAPERADQLVWMERMGRQSYLSNLLHTFVSWACIAAGKGGPKAVNEVLEFMRALPEDNTVLRGAIVGCFHSLMHNVDTLTLCLPDYYSALVGPDQLVRSNAATTLGEMKASVRNNLPSLVFEAFVAHLTDPYVIVHKAAARALERFTLPDTLSRTTTIALSNLILHYANDRRSDEFVVLCIDIYAHRYVQRERLSGPIGSALLDILKVVRPYAVTREIRHFGKLFGTNPNFPEFLFRLSEDDEAMNYKHEEIFEELKRLPLGSLYAHRASLVSLAAKLEVGRGLHFIGSILEMLTRAGAWQEAEAVSVSVFNAIEDSVRQKPLKLHAQLRMIACKLEHSLAKNVLAETDKAQLEWDATLKEINDDHEINRRRRDPLQGLLDKD